MLIKSTSCGDVVPAHLSLIGVLYFYYWPCPCGIQSPDITSLNHFHFYENNRNTFLRFDVKFVLYV